MNYISSAEDSSLAISKTFRKHGKFYNIISKTSVFFKKIQVNV